MKKRNLMPILAIIYYLTAICAYVSSIFYFCSENSSLGVVWLCIGSTMLCLGSVCTTSSLAKKKKDNNNKNDDDKPEDEGKKEE